MDVVYDRHRWPYGPGRIICACGDVLVCVAGQSGSIQEEKVNRLFDSHEEMKEKTLSQGLASESWYVCLNYYERSDVMGHKAKKAKAWRRVYWVDREEEKWKTKWECIYLHSDQVGECLSLGERRLANEKLYNAAIHL